MNKQRKAVGLVDLAAVGVCIAMLVGVAVPSLSRARELSNRMRCALNLEGIGASCRVYADRNDSYWPAPPFEQSSTGQNGTGINYTNPGVKGGVGYARQFASTAATAVNRQDGSTSLSTTRAFWMLVRAGDIPTPQFVCPSSTDIVDPTTVGEIDSYYDFSAYENVSYGYRIPFVPLELRLRDSVDSRIVVAADKGPYGAICYYQPFVDENLRKLEASSSPAAWRPFNSPNHGGPKNGEGQNCLFGDGSVSFARRPTVGVDHDNIYTLATPDWNRDNSNLLYGEAPCDGNLDNPFPGQEAFPGREYCSTDSLIFP